MKACPKPSNFETAARTNPLEKLPPRAGIAAARAQTEKPPRRFCRGERVRVTPCVTEGRPPPAANICGFLLHMRFLFDFLLNPCKKHLFLSL